jgi:hypothetical protein
MKDLWGFSLLCWDCFVGKTPPSCSWILANNYNLTAIVEAPTPSNNATLGAGKPRYRFKNYQSYIRYI